MPRPSGPTPRRSVRRQLIDSEYCKDNGKAIDIQLSCPDGQILFPNAIESSDAKAPRFRPGASATDVHAVVLQGIAH